MPKNFSFDHKMKVLKNPKQVLTLSQAFFTLLKFEKKHNDAKKL